MSDAEIKALQKTVADLENRLKTLEGVLKVEGRRLVLGIMGSGSALVFEGDIAQIWGANGGLSFVTSGILLSRGKTQLSMDDDKFAVNAFDTRFNMWSDHSVEIRTEDKVLVNADRDVRISAARDIDIKAGHETRVKGSRVSPN